MTKRSFSLCLKICFSIIFLCLVNKPVFASDNVVLKWNDAALQSVRVTRLGPPQFARALGIIHTAMYDAWAAYDPVAVGTRLGGALRRPASERTDANKQKAVSFAAYRALVDLFPTQKSLFDSLMTELGYNPADVSTDITTAAGVGNVAAAAVLDFRHRDGSNQLGDLSPGAYSDYTGYTPVNSPDEVVDINRWQPLRLPNGQVQRFLVPHWGLVTPFAMTSGSQFRSGPVALFPSDRFRTETLEVLQLSGGLNDTRKAIAEYWSDGPGSESPPGHWQLHAQFVSRRDNHTLDDDIKMFFALGNALLDASIAVWETKRFYDCVRPITAIRQLFKGKWVLAWAGPFQGNKLIDGKDWQPYQVPSFVTPPFAEYVSGHSTFSSASAEILKSFTGSDVFGASAVVKAGSSLIEPGATPAFDVNLSWRTFSIAADEAGLSRRYGGIHIRQGDLRGRTMGRLIGAQTWQKALTFFNGTAN
jgi:uncharacterized protein DUF6851/vanadium-dependent haloperoxidase-like protein